MKSFQADLFDAVVGGLWRGFAIGVCAFLPALVIFTLLTWGTR